MAFVQRLDSELKKVDPNYQNNTIFLADGAAYHTDKNSLKFMQQIGWNVIISAPYSYAASPIEMYFGIVKSVDMNKLELPAGKSKQDPALIIF